MSLSRQCGLCPCQNTRRHLSGRVPCEVTRRSARLGHQGLTVAWATFSWTTPPQTDAGAIPGSTPCFLPLRCSHLTPGSREPPHCASSFPVPPSSPNTSHHNSLGVVLGMEARTLHMLRMHSNTPTLRPPLSPLHDIEGVCSSSFQVDGAK